MAEIERRRRRPPISCVLCRRRKVRCNRETPCSNCLRSKNASCIYENQFSQSQQESELHSSTPTIAAAAAPSLTSKSSPRAVTAATTSTPASYQSSKDIEFLKDKIKQLEEQLSQSNRTARSPIQTPGSNIEAISSRIGGTFYIHHEDTLAGQPPGISRSVTHKSRMFGQSHWITGMSLVRDILALIEPHIHEEGCRITTLMLKSKSLARSIKAKRNPPWPLPLVTDLPPKDIADELVDRYFQTAETVYRILHIPSFKREYEAHWISPAESNSAFLVQLKLVLAIGATTYDEKFTLRASAMRWVYEAQTWVSEPGFKHRLNIQYLQNNILLLLAREFVDVGPDLVWISAGTLVRIAVYMGLHKDPTRLPKMSTFIAEMRRRLWNTILELSLQLSVISGGPPFISLDMFSTEPPGNFDDEQLTVEDPPPQPESHFTQTSVAIILRKIFPARLAVVKFLNDHGSSGTYKETLQLDSELRASYKSALRILQGYKSATGSRPSEYAMDALNLLMNRYCLSLHIPFFAPAMDEAAYAFSRRVVVETSLKIWRGIFPSPLALSSQSGQSVGSPSQLSLVRLAVCASGFFRISPLQASVLIASELIGQLREEETLGPGLIRQDLLSVVREAKNWAWKCIEAGETSIKGYFLASLHVAHIEGLMQGLEGEELSRYVVREGEKAEEMCLPVLEEMLANGKDEGSTRGLEQNTPSQLVEDWDLTMSGALFDFGEMELVNWGFDENDQELSFG
ncbi:putative C6 transcription factor [Daldinia caldariorum]|uniref:putative C6 transcription factor n=1 Tax=Daldinia caldariorum TaxID=326644 RepID=UPI002007367A|nr:putative C6 transcription factor [Daldinia caldariorum]KAI1471652.1 putative C6 transcription factor [Daldinia caldariorum]